MMRLPAMLLQAVTAAAPAPLPDPPARTATVAIPTHVRPPCEASPAPEVSEPDVIVVCGRRQDDRFRLRPIPLPAGMKPPVDGPGVDFDMGPAHGNRYATQVVRPDGLSDQRIMVTLKMPF